MFAKLDGVALQSDMPSEHKQDVVSDENNEQGNPGVLIT